MNINELTKVVAKKHGITKVFAGQIVQTVIETIRAEVKDGGSVRIRNFGMFEARESHGKLRAKFTESKNFFR